MLPIQKACGILVLLAWFLESVDCRPGLGQERAGGVDGLTLGRTDRFGNPLPRGARARLGTSRFRHGAAIHSVSFSANGKNLAADDGYGNYLFWEVATGKKLGEIGGGPYAFFPQHKPLLLGPKGCRIGLLDVGTGKVRRWFHDQQEDLRYVTFSPDGRTAASVVIEGKPTICLWDVPTGKELRQLDGHRDRVYRIAFSSDGNTLASTESGDTVRLWDVARGKQLLRFKAENCVGSDIVFSPDGKIVALAGNPMIGLWSLATGREILRFQAHEGWVDSIAFTPDGKMLLSAGNRTICVWDVATGRKLREVRGFGGSINTIAVSPDGKTVASGGDDDTIRLWDLTSGRERVPAEGHQGTVLATRFSPDGSSLISGGRDARIGVWDPVSGHERSLFRVFEAQVQTVAVSPDGSTVATAGNFGDHTVRILSVTTGKEVARLGHTESIRSLAFAPDGNTLAAGAGGSCVYLWEVSTGRRLRTLQGHETIHRREAWGAPCLAFSSDGRFLASGGADDTIIIWNLLSGEKRFQLTVRPSGVVALAFSPDGRTLASGSRYGGIRLWEMATGKGCGRMAADPFGAHCLAFSKDGEVLASGGHDKLIHLWNLSTARDDRRLAGHIGSISTVTFSPDGKTLASGSEDTTILLWDVSGSTLKEPLAAGNLTQFDLRNCWHDLSRQDATNAYQSLWRLVRARNQTVHFLREQLQPAPAVDERHIARLIAELDDTQFEVREKASDDLENLSVLAEPALRAALARATSLEVRRRGEGLLKRLEGPVTDPDQLQAIRGVAVLEHIASPEARELLKTLAQGAPQALLTREAKQALDRLNRLPPRK